MEDHENYCDEEEYFDDFYLDVRKKNKAKQQVHAESTVSIVLKKMQQLNIWPSSVHNFQKLIIDKKIIDIGDVIKTDQKSTQIEAIANTSVKPFEELKDKNVVIEIFHNEADFKGPIHIYSRYTPIGDEDTDEPYEPVTSGMKFDHDSLTLMRLKNIAVNKSMQHSKTLAEVIKENPGKIVKIFQEIMNLILDVEVRDFFFWSHNSDGAKNIFWWNQKWIVLNGEYKVANAGFISNLIKVLDLFRAHGMSMKQLENEFWKAFQDNVWRRRPRYVYARISKQYFKDE